VDAPIRAATAWRHLRPLLYNSRKKAPPFAGPTFIVSPRFALLLPLLICTLIGAQTSTADARALFEERRYPEAEAAFAARIAIRPDDAEAHFYLGRLALARQQIAESLPHLERAVELAPNQTPQKFPQLLLAKKAQQSQWSRQQVDERQRHTKSQRHQVAQNAQSLAHQDHAPSLASRQALHTHSQLSPK
jgi:tetratricopeptide (TPR) repeat protein